MNNKVLKLAMNNSVSELASSIYLKGGIDLTYPTQVYAQMNESCNSKCVMCDVWRSKSKEEIPARAWIEGLNKLKAAIGCYKICFAGGEVFLKRGMFDILEACHKKNITFGITTNGILLTKANVERYISLEPFNVNISLDSINPAVYERIRGVPALDTIMSNIEYLLEYKRKVRSKIIITLKTVVNNWNLSELEDIAGYAANIGVDSITFDPIKRKRNYFKEMVINEFEDMYRMDKGQLSEAIHRLKELKRAGYPIMNSEKNMDDWLEYDNLTSNNVCKVPLRNLILDPNGDIRLCDFIDTKIGNIQDKDIKEVLKSAKTREIKHSMVRCKQPCVYCTKRTISDYIRLFGTYVKAK